MEMITMTKGQMGISCLESRGDLAISCSWKRGFLSSWGPGFGVALNVKRGKRMGVFGLRIEALSRAESEGRLVSAGIVEKEFEFRPSFDEYLKAMESVKSGREKKQVHKVDGEKLLNDKEGNRETLLGGDGKGLKRSRGEMDQVEMIRVQENDWLSENEDGINGCEDGHNNEFEYRRREIRVHNDRHNREASGATAKRKSGGVTRDGQWLNSRSHVLNPELDNRYKAKNILEASGIKTSAKPIGKEMKLSLGMLEKKGKDFAVEDGARVHKMDTFLRNQVEVYKSPSKESLQKSGSLSRRESDFPENDGGGMPELERAAFRNFEDLSNVIGKPRVSKMEMEERIQKLAKCLNGADIDVPEWIFSKMIRSARIKFSDHSMLRVIQILGKLGNWRRVLQVIEWLQTRERYKSNRLRYVYTAALDVLGKARRPVEALNVFCAMQQHMSSYPDLVAYHSIAVTLGQAGHMKELFDVIDSMQSPPTKKFKTGALGKWDPRLEPDIVVYNAVLNACVQRKQWEGAFWVLQQLKEQGQQPTAATYGLIMEVMLSCGKYNLVHDFFRKVHKSSIPNALAYKVLVNTLWREGKPDEAVLAIQDMERRGIVGSAALYYDLARCLCSAGRSQEAIAQVEKICQVASKPLVVTYTGLLQACVDSGHIQDAAHIFSHMQHFCSPNLVTCNIMLKAYFKHGFFEDAKELFYKMAEDGNHIRSKSDHHFRVLPDIFTFNTILDACIAEKRWDNFEYIYGRMLKHGYHFNAKRHLRMILDALRAGKEEPLELTWRHLVKVDRSPPPPLVKERFCLMLERNNFNSALACIRPDIAGELEAFSKKAWLNLFEENSQRFRADILIRLIHEADIVVSRDNEPNPALQNLLTSCNEFLRTRRELLVRIPCGRGGK